MSIYDLSEKLRGASEMARLRRLSEETYATLPRKASATVPPPPPPAAMATTAADTFIFTAR